MASSTTTGADASTNSSGLHQTQAGSSSIGTQGTTTSASASQTSKIRTQTATQTQTSSQGTQTEPDQHETQTQAAQPAPRQPRSKYAHITAVHSEAQPSCLSHDSTAAPSFIGFRNLMGIVLVASNLRLMIENAYKYGVLICFRCHDFRRSDLAWGLGLYFMIPVFLFIAYFIEYRASLQAKGLKKRYSTSRQEGTDGQSDEERARFRRTWIIIAWLHMVNITAALGFTTYCVYFEIRHPLIGTLTELHAIIVWLKTVSYAFTNRDLRHAYLHPTRDDRRQVPSLYNSCQFPNNINFSNLCYFWWAPTLVYQPVYPRTSHIRWTFVAKRLGEIFILSVAIWLLTAQYATPTLFNSLATIHTMNVASIAERILKLSTISLVIWLCGFFALFQSFMNALAEMMCFGDRNFYDDWWNSPSLGVYWRTWNKPVYQFFKRHVYSPMRARGWNDVVSSLVVFLFSGVLHELLVGVPTHNMLGAAFSGMFFQIVLIKVTEPFENSTSLTQRMVGNSIFWLSFTIIGQPMAALIYFYGWQSKYGSVAKDLAHLGTEENLAMKILLPGSSPN
ncbi:hypothetical protein MKZ38_010353 [Zalerion maritima]|uniref:O-acyltransferase n=1 Tax=Zalerion maritima TaxID=339359 RepID=A0AAD5RY57_9PEZI|nr:hypothetical protein MKZ38_010353 [Zalerion maritima]